MNDLAHIGDIASKYGLGLDDLRSLLVETDAARGLLGPEDLDAGLRRVVATYVQCLGAAAERVADPIERLAVDRFVGQVVDLLADQLGAAIVKPN